ncbi:MAG TPA: glycogen-binding domain-containing protein [Gemmatimonadales bacterium]|nr:glycogen-binding domain-containing protein [Gemmatimonadales bacterium]
MSSVRYDGFLPSGAAAVTPALRWERPGGTLAARGTYLRFESGHRSVQGSVTGELFPPANGRWRAELLGSAGASRYLDFASFWHATGEARLHWLGEARGAWIGATGGRTSYGAAPRPVAVVAAGIWTRRPQLTLAASASRSFVGDTVYTDILSTAQARRGILTLDASVGARVSSRGGGHGVFSEVSATLALGERTALFASGGRYPTDPINGSVAGRYLSGGVRIRITSRRALVSPQPVWYGPSRRSAGTADPVTDARLDVRLTPDGLVRLVIHAPDSASTVELAGDFTDWQPVALQRAGVDSWEVVMPIASGVHRLNVRIGQGEWIVPWGATRTADDFGADVGIVAIP